MQRTIQFILNHPLTKRRPVSAILNFLRWQLVSRIVKKPVVHQFTANSKLLVWKGLTGATGNIYCGLHEFEDMAFLLHFLRDTDLFVDVGANIGSYTVLASAEIGARTIALEPVPETFNNLVKNVLLNNAPDKVTTLNIGAGSETGALKFTKTFDTGNHVVNDDTTDSEIVNVDTLDIVLKGECPTLLKVDVEGFETEVLKGATNVLKSECLKAIIIELNGSGSRYGYDDNQLHLKLLSHGFKAYQYHPFERLLTETESNNKEHNTLYIRDYALVAKHIKEGKKQVVKGVSF